MRYQACVAKLIRDRGQNCFAFKEINPGANQSAPNTLMQSSVSFAGTDVAKKGISHFPFKLSRSKLSNEKEKNDGSVLLTPRKIPLREHQQHGAGKGSDTDG
jgi:hypothetical protein